MAGSGLLGGGLVWPIIGAELVVRGGDTAGAVTGGQTVGARPHRRRGRHQLGRQPVQQPVHCGPERPAAAPAAALAGPLRLERPMMVIAAVLMIGLAQDGVLTGLDGDVLAVPPCSRLWPPPV
jgi:hypothetical protein